MPQNQLFEFGPFRLDVGMSRLERAGATIPVPPKAFDLLLLLARTTDRILSKSELMEALWPKTFVEDANLTQHVYTLRKALGDRSDGAPYIETVPRRGYRLNAAVRDVTVDRSAPPSSPREAVAASPPASRVTPAVMLEGERKQATVLDCGVDNAAALAERLGPVAFHDTMARVAQIAAEEIGRYDGILRQGHADEWVALFGARTLHEDDARRAALAALGIAARLRDGPAGTPDEERVVVRIGISSGPVVVSRRTDDSGVEYSAVGETMRIAHLLQQLADPGSILISEATRRAVEGYVELARTDVVAAGEATFQVLRPSSAAQARPPRFTRTLAPFVGRRQELALLEDLARRARSGNGQVVSIVGEPGMGKSRLVHEFSQSTGAGALVTLLEGKCLSYGSLVPYLPLVDLVRTQCGVSESDSPERIREGIERTVRAADLPADTGVWLLRLLGIADSARDTLSAEAIKARTFDALRALFLKTSLRTPLVMIIEDVHWIDRTSEEFLATLIERLIAARVLLVATHRPGYRAPWIDRSYVTQITLTPLTTDDSSRIVDSVARDTPIPQSVSAAILAKAEGNPFFLEELARAVLADGPEEPRIPDTIHGVIMARLDRLSESAKQLLQTASVLGREAPLRLLAHMRPTTDLETDLGELCQQEFLHERPGGDEPVFVFKHALTQDVAYDSLLARVRRDFHLEAARALEDLHGDRLEDITATLAYHYARTDLVDEAVTWSIRAADHAARAYANAEAIAHLDLARRRIERLPEGAARDRRTIDVALRHAHSLYFLGRFRDSVDALLPHEGRLGRLNDPALTAVSSFWLGHMFSRLGEPRRATDSANRAIEAATRAGDDATLGKAHGVLALEGHWSGRTTEGVAHGEEAVRLLGPIADQQWWLGMAHFYLATNHLLAGRFDDAIVEAARADTVGKAIGDPRLQTYAGYTTGWIEASRGRTDAAIAACRASLERAPDRVSRAYASLFLGFSLVKHGDHAQAVDELQVSIRELEGFGFPQWHALAAVMLGEAQRGLGRLEEAAEATRSGTDIATRAQYWYAVGLGEQVTARIARDRGRVEDATSALESALLTFTRIGAVFEADCARHELATLPRR